MCDIPKDLPITSAIIREYLPRNLADLVVKYIMSPRRTNWGNAVECGEYETCLLIPEQYVDGTLSDACYYGHEEIINLLLQRKITDWGLVFSGAAAGNNMKIVEMAIANGIDGMWSYGLRSACIRGHKQMVEFIVSQTPKEYAEESFYETGIEYALINNRENIALSLLGRGYNDYNQYLISACGGGCMNLIDLLISRGGCDWNNSLYRATKGGHYDIAEIMISKGANNWNYGLHGAAFSGGIEFVKYMISKGANDWDTGLSGACRGGHLEIAKLMISHGASNYNYGLYDACSGGHLEIAKLMIGYGANDFNYGLFSAHLFKHNELKKFMIKCGASHTFECGGVCNDYSTTSYTFCMGPMDPTHAADSPLKRN